VVPAIAPWLLMPPGMIYWEFGGSNVLNFPPAVRSNPCDAPPLSAAQLAPDNVGSKYYGTFLGLMGAPTEVRPEVGVITKPV